MGYIAVIDTETNWKNEVMSIGVVIADSLNFEVYDYRYYIIEPEYKAGGLFSGRLNIVKKNIIEVCRRKEAIQGINIWLECNKVDSLFAYNASFDKKHLPELEKYYWYDIMRVAAYKQYNHTIPRGAECCKTGKLKRDYGVEPILRNLSGDRRYVETHNALLDAVDELKIMKLLEKNIEEYEHALI